jgi:hypothetical protein
MGLPSRWIISKGTLIATLYLAVWILAIPVFWVYWDDMNWLLKSAIVVSEIFFAPDVGAVRSALQRSPDY